MKTQILRGSKQEIAETLVRMNGEVREAIVFVDEPSLDASGADSEATDDMFAEMRAWMVDVADVSDSREAIYSRAAGE